MSNLWKTKSVKFSYIALLCLVGLMSFLDRPTAYTWGEQDIMPLIERIYDKDYLTNDFFTNASFTKNPRWIFGYFVAGISMALGLNWYAVLFILKLGLFILFPVLYFLVLTAIGSRYIGENKIKNTYFPLTVLIALPFLSTDFNLFFNVGDWRPFVPSLTAANLSLAIALMGILVSEWRYKWLLAGSVFFLSGLFHPVMAILTSAFYLPFRINFYDFKIKQLAPLFFSVLAAGLIALLFKTESNLTTEVFIHYYVEERHPWHYLVSEFSTYNENWKFKLALVLGLHLVPIIIAVRNNFKAILWTGILSLLIYILSLLSQYVFIEVIPLKFAAYFGPSRYLGYGYWSALLLWLLVAGNFLKSKKMLQLPAASLTMLGALVISLMVYGLIHLDNPWQMRSKKMEDLFEYIKNTDKKALFFSTSSRLNTDIRLIGNRAVLHSKEFPFAEGKIEEYHQRLNDIYGCSRMEKTTPGFSMENLKFLNEKYGLDYFIFVEQNSDNISAFKPSYNKHGIQIYQVNQFN